MHVLNGIQTILWLDISLLTNLHKLTILNSWHCRARHISTLVFAHTNKCGNKIYFLQFEMGPNFDSKVAFKKSHDSQ